MELPQLRVIGVVHGDIHSCEDAPKNFDESTRRGTLEIDRRYLEALDGIRQGDRIVVLFWLHRADRTVLKVHPRGDRSRPRRGVFATRSPARPNPIAISQFEVLALRDNCIDVSGLDILDGTPIIDIKNALQS